MCCEISSSHGGEYDVQSCLLGYIAVKNDCRPTFQRMMEAVHTSETLVDNHSTWQYSPEDSSEHQNVLMMCLRMHLEDMYWNTHICSGIYSVD
jgi:hypothetical protein